VRRNFFFYNLFFFVIFLSHLFALSFSKHVSPDLSWGFSTIASPAIELAFFSMLGLGIIRFGHKRFRVPSLIIGLLIPISVALIYLSQGYSAFVSGSYLTELALENIGETGYIKGLSIFLIGSCVVITWLCLSVVMLKQHSPSDKAPVGRMAWARSIIVLILFATVFNIETQPTDSIHLNPDVIPVTSLIYKISDILEARRDISSSFTESLVDVTFPKNVVVNLNSAFPLQQHQRISAPLPFVENKITDTPLNVIIIFAEGFSSRLLGAYGGPYPNLTPQLNEFAKEVMIVENYYNHTAATFRGLLGQLTSGYPHYGGSMTGGWAEKGKDNTEKLTNTRYQTLSNILRSNGYETFFFSPHSDKNHLNTMLRALDFDTVYSQEIMADHLDRPIKPQKGIAYGAVKDRDLFSGLIKLMKDRITEDNKDPFFAATYNIGTHAFLNVAEDGVRFGDGKNPALNRFHEFSTAIGPFLDYFKSSSYANNTLLIITSDHATFPEPPVVEAFDAPGFTRYFIDEMPLLVHAPNLILPERFDARYQNSISLAPTILHLLNIKNYQHAFLGRSLFDENENVDFSVANIGGDTYLINSDGVTRQTEKIIPESLKPHYNLIKLFKLLESTNRLFDTTR